MQAIIDSLPEHVLNYKDSEGRTIVDYEFTPFIARIDGNIEEIKECDLFYIVRPRYIMEEIECNGKKLKVIKEKVEGNIQFAIDNKIKNILIGDDQDYSCRYPHNSFEDDVYRLLDAGHIRALYLDGNLKSNGKKYHVDFMYNGETGGNITSYYNYGVETVKTVVLKKPIGAVSNNLITLGCKQDERKPYPDPITSKFIGNTKYTNVRDHQDILDMLDALKAKIEAF